MATTTNYSWTTPDDTGLVKDGASAIRTLGSSVDTTLKNLNPSTTLGDIEYRSSSANVNTRLGIGSTGQVLTVSGGVPAWASPAAGGGITLIQETVASGNSGISFTTIPGTYKHLVLTWHGLYHNTTGSWFAGRFNSDSGSSYAVNYATMEQTAGYGADSFLGTEIGAFGQNLDQSTNLYQMAMGTMTIFNYASTTKSKLVITESQHRIVSNSRNTWSTSRGTYTPTSAITQIDIIRGAGSATMSNYANTSIRLYGVS